MNHVIFFIIAFIAAVISSIAGFGSSTVLIPFGGLVLDFKTVIVLVAFFHLFSNAAKIHLFRKIDWNLFWKFGIPSIIFSIGGAFLSNYLNSEIIRFIFGIFLLTFTAYSLLKHRISFKPSNLVSYAGGSLSGLLSGLIGTGGAVRTLLLNSFSLKKEVFIATSAMVAIVIDISRIPVYFLNGTDTTVFIWMIPVLIVIALLGTWLGKLIVNKIPTEVFRKIVLAALFLIGLKLVLGI